MDLSRLLPEMSPALKRYYWRSVLPSLAFVVLVIVRVPLLAALPDTAPWRIGVGLLPMLAWFWMLYEYVRFLRACDELERRIEFGALVFGTGLGVSAAMALVLVLEFQPVDWGIEQVASLAVLVPLIASAIARHVLHRRYR